MKKLFAFLACLPITFGAFSAKLTATLQSGENVKPYYGENALIEACEAAVDGDIITLSPGVFTTTDLEIEKSVTIYGADGFSDDDAKRTKLVNLTVSGDNVKLEGIYFSGNLTINAGDNLTINRSYIAYLRDKEKEDDKYHDNTIVNDCMIEQCYSMKLSKNAVFRNSCVGVFGELNDPEYPALIENCNIPDYTYYSSSTWVVQPYAIYRSCFLGMDFPEGNTFKNSWSFSSPSEFINCVFFPNYNDGQGIIEWSINFTSCVVENCVILTDEDPYFEPTSGNFANKYKWNDMTPYIFEDITYGPRDPKLLPSIPEITSAEIDTETDSEGVLHVKITAVARD